jgi:hypothetical protein
VKPDFRDFQIRTLFEVRTGVAKLPEPPFKFIHIQSKHFPTQIPHFLLHSHKNFSLECIYIYVLKEKGKNERSRNQQATLDTRALTLVRKAIKHVLRM